MIELNFSIDRFAGLFAEPRRSFSQNDVCSSLLECQVDNRKKELRCTEKGLGFDSKRVVRSSTHNDLEIEYQSPGFGLVHILCGRPNKWTQGDTSDRCKVKQRYGQ